MTDEAWQEMQENKVRFEKMQWLSKTIGNALRYRAFIEYNQNGLGSAKELLEGDITKISNKVAIGDDGFGKIRSGLIAELDFFDSYRECFSLCPTLDAGCAFDFVGKVPDDAKFNPLRFGGKFIRIDVTTSINCKRDKEIVSSRGQKQWPLLFAHIHDNKLAWYTEKLDASLLSDSLALSEVPFAGKRNPHHVALARYRRECLEQIEFGCKLNDVFDRIRSIDQIKEDDRKTLEAQIIFFSAYKYALNIVPALSCGDSCDFIGEHDGEFVKYRVLMSTRRYLKAEYSIISQLSKKFRYKVALFDDQTKMFTFYDFDDCQLFDDIPDLDATLN